MKASKVDIIMTLHLMKILKIWNISSEMKYEISLDEKYLEK